MKKLSRKSSTKSEKFEIDIKNYEFQKAIFKKKFHPIIYIFRFDAKIKQDSIYEFKINRQLPQTQ